LEEYKKLIKNIGLLSISNFGSKILIFLLVPLYTNILSTYEYGSYDLVVTSINLLIPILTLEISSGVLRFALDKDVNGYNVFTVGLTVTIKGVLGLLAIIVVNNFINVIPAINDYYIFFILMYLSNALYQLCSNYARGIDEVKLVAFAGIIQTIFLVLFNIFLLVILELGISGFFLANIISLFISAFYLYIKLRLYKINIFECEVKLLRTSMINYSRPLVLNSISWWINNTADRYIVTWMCGIAANGIYSIAYKIPTIMNSLQSVFLQAWQISAVQEFDSNDKRSFYENVYQFYNFGNVIFCSLIIIFSKAIAHFMFSKDFYDAWIFVPFLLVAYIFGAMSGFIGGIFSAVKDTKIYSYSTIIGAIINIISNLLLINHIGILGAAVATMISYMVIWCIRILNAKKYINLRLNLIRDLLSYLMLLLQAMVMLKFTSYRLYIIEFTLLLILLIIYKSEIRNFVKIIRNEIK